MKLRFSLQRLIRVTTGIAGLVWLFGTKTGMRLFDKADVIGFGRGMKGINRDPSDWLAYSALMTILTLSVYLIFGPAFTRKGKL